MNEESNLPVSRPDNRRGERKKRHHDPNADWAENRRRIDGRSGGTRVIGTGVPYGETIVTDLPRKRRFDPVRLLDALTKRWYWIVGSGLVLGAIAMVCGFWVTDYAVRVQLSRRATLNAFSLGSGDGLLQDRSLQTLFRWMSSPEVLRRVAAKMDPPMTPQAVAEAVRFQPDRNPDFVNLVVSGQDPNRMVQLANLYAEEAVKYTQEIQANEAGEISYYLARRLEAVNAELRTVNDQLTQFAREAEVLDFEKEVEAYLTQRQSVDLKYETARIELETLDLRRRSLETELARQSPSNDRLHSARDQLQDLLATRAEAHPDVQKLKAYIASLEQMQAPASTNVFAAVGQGNSLANAIYLQILELKAQRDPLIKQMEEYARLRDRVQERVKALSGRAAEYALIKGQRQNLDAVRQLLVNRQREAQLLHDNALGYFRIDSLATPEGVQTNRRYLIVLLLTGMGACAGAFISGGILLVNELMDARIKTVADVRRVTGLPVFATLGDLRRMSPAEQVNWAFRTLTILQGKLNGSPDKSLVCGFISSQHGEGRSTWINLLVSAASQRGLRVLTVSTRPNQNGDTLSRADKTPSLLPVGPRTTLSTNVLAFPSQVTEQFTDPEAQPVIHIPLPGWVWNLERRRQWQSALEQWRQIENLVLLIELPPASQPESVLLAENLPQVIWLTNSGMATADETQQHLETLRHAQCQVVGAVLNREPSSFWRTRFGGFLQRFSAVAAAVFALAGNSITNAQEGAAPAESRVNAQAEQPRLLSGSFTVGRPERLAPWQERLTLGPGDVLDLALFGNPELTRTNLVVGPDGTISYLQAQGVRASGLTVDELREKLDQQLSRYYPAARTIISPVSYNSKKYYVLGRVAQRGAFTLDRPVTIIEAVAKARGLETGLVEGNTVETADLSRSFLIRNGQAVPVNFERLFRHGDLSQNIALEPGDYLYFSSSELNEVYVLGEVNAPGVSVFIDDTSVIAALAARGGFTEEAYKKKVLVVRGSLEQPETFVINTAAVLAGREPNFKLRPRDIVYVSARPWVKVEELLNLAVEAFIQAAVTTWVGTDIGPIITTPVIR